MFASLAYTTAGGLNALMTASTLPAGNQPLTPGDLSRQDWSDVDRYSVCHRRFPDVHR